MGLKPNFSSRTNWNLEENELSKAARATRMSGGDLVDLTRSNPTVCGFDYGRFSREPFEGLAAARYDPQPLGTVEAREAIADYYADHGATVETKNICLTTSTSEAYSFLFRLLCDSGDEVLVPRPSYPLFEFIAQLSDIGLREYPLYYDPNADSACGWSIDFEALEAAITPRCRAVLFVHPNNPTGNFAMDAERARLKAICARKGLALIVDEVFLDYALLPNAPGSFAAGPCECLCFVLSGLSKVCALPQMKISWIVSVGPDEVVAEAMARLEMIADTFLSMNAPGQLALPAWLKERRGIQEQILERMRANVQVLDATVAGTQVQRLEIQGGWTAILRVPRMVGDVPFAMAALERGVFVQPGEFYGLPEGRMVLSLLTPVEEWARGIARLHLHG